MATWHARTAREITEVHLEGARLARVEMLGDGSCLHVQGLAARCQAPQGDVCIAFRQDARLLLFGVSETTISGGLTGNDPVATATLLDDADAPIPWIDALRGVPAVSLSLELASGAALALQCSRATLGLEGEATLFEGWMGSLLAISPNGPENFGATGSEPSKRPTADTAVARSG